ncbi:hypothetical protein LTR37_001550 [Vermiconidia calcicola]|uniref:Uncharacterized protein n=1 Tax=Vermiconidia calcicola TaxID=1690605 RepID=A0ACC3NV23_9PEZI|nr:hypothetical protein LTR37_001550 [Vermiconidia calcicola]
MVRHDLKLVGGDWNLIKITRLSSLSKLLWSLSPPVASIQSKSLSNYALRPISVGVCRAATVTVVLSTVVARLPRSKRRPSTSRCHRCSTGTAITSSSSDLTIVTTDPEQLGKLVNSPKAARQEALINKPYIFLAQSKAFNITVHKLAQGNGRLKIDNTELITADTKLTQDNGRLKKTNAELVTRAKAAYLSRSKARARRNTG